MPPTLSHAPPIGSTMGSKTATRRGGRCSAACTSPERWHQLEPANPARHELSWPARQAGAQLGHEANFAWTAFGPTNVAVRDVSVALELGDFQVALRSL
jgi:hypothetical protein